VQQLNKLTTTCCEKEHLGRKVLVSIMHAMEAGAAFEKAHDDALKAHA